MYHKAVQERSAIEPSPTPLIPAEEVIDQLVEDAAEKAEEADEAVDAAVDAAQAVDAAGEALEII